MGLTIFLMADGVRYLFVLDKWHISVLFQLFRKFDERKSR